MGQEHQFQHQQASDHHGPDNVDLQQGTEQHQQHPHHVAPNQLAQPHQQTQSSVQPQ